MAEYTIDEAIEKTGAKVIKGHHKHLAQSNIVWLRQMYDPEAPGRGRPPAAGPNRTPVKTKVFNAAERAATGLDFLVVVDGKLWDSLDKPVQEAFMDMGLAGLTYGPDGPGKRPPDVVAFTDVVARRGAFYESLQEFADKTRQSLLPFPEGEGKDTVTH